MPPVFGHGRLRLYLLKLLKEAPRHGYEVIRLLEERFQGLYAPSAGTVYPRLAKLEEEGLVTHATEGGRKVYSITDRGREELAGRQDELTDLEREIRDSLASLASDIRADVSGSAHALRLEMKEQAHRSGTAGKRDRTGKRDGRQTAADHTAGEQSPHDSRQEWQAERQNRKEREAHIEAAQEIGRIAREVQEQMLTQTSASSWQGTVQHGFSELARHVGDLGRIPSHTTGWPPYTRPEPAGEPAYDEQPDDGYGATGGGAQSSGDPARDLERLLDRFRDDMRDAARDSGVSEEQLPEIRRHLSTAAAHIGVLLRVPDTD
ncbi:PadR family transcriptional regulator [Streptomyces oceani]|uniref:Transcription regulator PadR N-terminal domain-containing protein n=1 Tax=Streptomyces oceani TaxID=1075402 RepID=A0A1E7KPP8_9ACTN|nr:PadR family transcriptional regulator [Streptomyces oceani]OEV05831.1 hypothetical protein AN216_01385 [Streptomyces oceani]